MWHSVIQQIRYSLLDHLISITELHRHSTPTDIGDNAALKKQLYDSALNRSNTEGIKVSNTINAIKPQAAVLKTEKSILKPFRENIEALGKGSHEGWCSWHRHHGHPEHGSLQTYAVPRRIELLSCRQRPFPATPRISARPFSDPSIDVRAVAKHR